MANVVPFAFACREPAAEPALHRRIRRYSRLLMFLFAGLAALYAVLAGAILVAMLVYRGNGLQIGPADMQLVFDGSSPEKGYLVFGSLPLMQRIAYALVGVVRTVPGVAILIELRALFSLYAGGIVFARRNADRIRNIGAWLAIDALAPFACHLLLSSTGFEIDRNWAHLESFKELVLGALVFVIALVMRVGSDIESERSEFV